jgi:hypothetical protein
MTGMCTLTLMLTALTSGLFGELCSGPGYEPAESHLDHLVSVYGQPTVAAAVASGRG